jgi:nitrilase
MSHSQPGPMIAAESLLLSTPHARDSALEQACERIVDAGLAGARWAIFPEGSIPGYPLWVWTLSPGDHPLLNALWAETMANTVQVPSAVTDRLCSIAQRAHINVAIGVIERAGTGDTANVYNTLLFINAQGRIIAIYRRPCTSAQHAMDARGERGTRADIRSSVSRRGNIATPADAIAWPDQRTAWASPSPSLPLRSTSRAAGIAPA